MHGVLWTFVSSLLMAFGHATAVQIEWTILAERSQLAQNAFTHHYNATLAIINGFNTQWRDHILVILTTIMFYVTTEMTRKKFMVAVGRLHIWAVSILWEEHKCVEQIDNIFLWVDVFSCGVIIVLRHSSLYSRTVCLIVRALLCFQYWEQNYDSALAENHEGNR